MDLQANFSGLQPFLECNRIHFLVVHNKLIKEEKRFLSDRLSVNTFNKRYAASIRLLEAQRAGITRRVRQTISARQSELLNEFKTNNGGVSLSGIRLVDFLTGFYYFEKGAINYVRGVTSCNLNTEISSDGHGDLFSSKYPVTAQKISLNLSFRKRYCCILMAFLLFGFLLFSQGCRSTEDLYDHVLFGENSSPEGTRIEAYQGPDARTANVNNKAYAIRFTTEMLAEKFDSVVGTAPGHQRKAIYDVTITQDKNLEFNLEKIIIPPKKFTLHGEESTPGATGNVWDDGNELTTFTTDGNGDYATGEQELPADQKLDSIAITAPGKDRLVLTYVNVVEGANKVEFNLDDTHYSHTWQGGVTSSKAGKQIKDGTKAGLVLASNNQDTTWTATLAQAYAFSKTTTNASEDYAIIIKEAPGHDDKTRTGTSTGTNNVQDVLTAKTYSATIPLLVKNTRNEPIIAALITYTGGSKTTDSQGEATITEAEMATNEYNELLAAYAKNTTTTKTGYQDKQQSVPYGEGTNPQTTITLDDLLQTNTITYVTNVTAGTAWLVEQGQTDTLYAAIGGNGRASIGFTHIAVDPDHTLAIGARSSGKIAQSRTRAVSGDNDYEETFTLEDQQQNNTFAISGRGHLIGAVVAGLPNEAIDYLNDGEIRFTTKKDMANHDISIDNQGYFDGDITGPYTATDSIIITYVNNPLVTTNTFSFLDGSKVASVGKIKNDNGTYVASAQEQRFVQRTARTTIGKLADKNLAFIAFSDQAYTLPDDLANITGVTGHGVISYIGETVTFVNDTININTGQPLTPTQIQEQQAAIDFLADQMTTRTGITLANTNKIKSDNTIWNNYQYKCIIYKTNIQAANTKYYITPTTFNASDAHTRPTEGLSLIIREGGEGQLNIYDLINGTNANGFFVQDGTIQNLSWEGDVAKNTSYLFPEGFFKKK